jgi:hypothetical protein
MVNSISAKDPANSIDIEGNRVKNGAEFNPYFDL